MLDDIRIENENLKKKINDLSNSDINPEDVLQEEINDLNSQINDLENEKQNLVEDIDEIKENIKKVKLVPTNPQEKEAIDIIIKILNKNNI